MNDVIAIHISGRVAGLYVTSTHARIKMCAAEIKKKREKKRNSHRHVNNDAFEKLIMLEIPAQIRSREIEEPSIFHKASGKARNLALSFFDYLPPKIGHNFASALLVATTLSRTKFLVALQAVTSARVHVRTGMCERDRMLRTCGTYATRHAIITTP